MWDMTSSFLVLDFYCKTKRHGDDIQLRSYWFLQFCERVDYSTQCHKPCTAWWPVQNSQLVSRIHMDDCTVCCLRVQHRLAVQSWQEEPASKIFLGDTHLPNFWWYAIKTGLIRSDQIIHDWLSWQWLAATQVLLPSLHCKMQFALLLPTNTKGKSFQQKKKKDCERKEL